jgi:hypothetical protein
MMQLDVRVTKDGGFLKLGKEQPVWIDKAEKDVCFD